MTFFIFARFHVRDTEAASALREVVRPTGAEPGCLAIDAFAATRNPRLFYIHSRWVDEAAFELHATLAHTVRLIEIITPLIDHPFEATRARVMEQGARLQPRTERREILADGLAPDLAGSRFGHRIFRFS